MSACNIINAKCDAIIVSEIELGKVSTKVLFLALLICAALEQAEKAFNGICGCDKFTAIFFLDVTNILARAMLHGGVF